MRRMVKQGRMFDWAGKSQYCFEPKRLPRLGYLTSRSRLPRLVDREVEESPGSFPRQLERAGQTAVVGTMFWLNWNRLSGSHSDFTASSRRYFSCPKEAWRTSSGGSATKLM